MQTPKTPLRTKWQGTGYRHFKSYMREGGPDVDGCGAAGDTLDETRRNFQDALAAPFEAMREVGEPIPEPHSSVEYVEVAA